MKNESSGPHIGAALTIVVREDAAAPMIHSTNLMAAKSEMRILFEPNDPGRVLRPHGFIRHDGY